MFKNWLKFCVSHVHTTSTAQFRLRICPPHTISQIAFSHWCGLSHLSIMPSLHFFCGEGFGRDNISLKSEWWAVGSCFRDLLVPHSLLVVSLHGEDSPYLCFVIYLSHLYWIPQLVPVQSLISTGLKVSWILHNIHGGACKWPCFSCQGCNYTHSDRPLWVCT